MADSAEAQRERKSHVETQVPQVVRLCKKCRIRPSMNKNGSHYDCCLCWNRSPSALRAQKRRRDSGKQAAATRRYRARHGERYLAWERERLLRRRSPRRAFGKVIGLGSFQAILRGERA